MPPIPGVPSASITQQPKSEVSVGASTASGGSVSNASRVIAALRAGLRACYARELAENPNAQGRIRFSVHVGVTGNVESVDAMPDGLPSRVTECAKARIRAAQFNAPQGGTAVVVFPVTFKPPT